MIQSPAGRTGRAIRLAFAGILFIYLFVYVPLPYVIFSPGSAEATKPMVSVEAGHAEERGVFMLTTVHATTYTNVIAYLASFFNRHADVIPRKDVFGQAETREEYSQLQTAYMRTSQANAIEAAYRKAKVPYRIDSEGVVAMTIIKDMPADGVLRPGDRILQLNGKKVSRYEDLANTLRTLSEGESVSIEAKRGEESVTAVLQVKPLPNPVEGGPKFGLGISTAEMLAIRAENPAQQVEIKAGAIGGPSAGLMFALEIYNRLVPEDITKGYTVAGTGTIDSQGRVGTIGGVGYKIVASERKKADLFFSPPGNFEEAKRKAEQIGAKLRVVRVETMDDALSYLASLPPKSATP